MSSEFLVALGSVVIDASNDTIQLDEGGSVAAATIAHATYYPRGDGTAADLLKAVATALGAAFGGGNTYAVTLTTDGTTPSPCITASAAAAKVHVARATGSTSFRVRWNHTGTTFDKKLLGFASEKTAASAASEVSTLTPACIWVASDRHVDLTPATSYVAAQEDMADGGLEVTRRSSQAHRKQLLLEMIDGRRIWLHRSTSDPARTWQSFLRRHGDGRALELHELDLQSSTSALLGAPSASTRVKVVDDLGIYTWKLAGNSIEDLAATRVRGGTDLWDLDVLFRGIATDIEVPAPPGAPIVWLDGADIDGSDNETLASGVSKISSWTNKGTNGTPATQATSTAQPLFAVDSSGRAGATFSGGSGTSVNNDWLDIVIGATAQPITVAVVMSGDSTGGSYSILHNRTADLPFLSRGASGFSSAPNSISFVLGPGSHTPAGVGVFEAVVVDINGASSAMLINDPAATPITGNVSSGSPILLRIGANSATGFALSGRILEVAVWQGASRPTNAEVLAWLVEKYGSFPQ